jgi:hypothetical protein
VDLGKNGINGTRDVALGLGDNLEAVGKVPTSVITITGDGNGVNGSTVDNSNKTVSVDCPQNQTTGAGAPATTTGGTTPTTNSGTRPGDNNATSNCTASAGK